jgi:hypothetical protein
MTCCGSSEPSSIALVNLRSQSRLPVTNSTRSSRIISRSTGLSATSLLPRVGMCGRLATTTT